MSYFGLITAPALMTLLAYLGTVVLAGCIALWLMKFLPEREESAHAALTRSVRAAGRGLAKAKHRLTGGES